MKQTEAVVIMPAYNPDKVLVKIVEKLAMDGIPVIVVDDGSRAECQCIFHTIQDICIVLHHHENCGKGAAIKTALIYVKNKMQGIDTIGIMDADGQHCTEDMIRLLAFSKKQRRQLCLGVRSVGKNMPVKSRLGNMITRTVFHFITGVRVSDTQTGLRAFDIALLPVFLSASGERYEYEMNMLFRCSEHQISIKELEIKTIYHDEKNSCSHFSAFKDSLRIYKDIIKFTLSSLSSFLLDYLLFAMAMVFLPHTVGTIIVGNVVARVISAFYNYSMNCRHVFHTSCRAETALEYLVLAVVILFLNNIVLSFLTQVIYVPVYLAKLITECILFLISWIVQKYMIFNNNKMGSQRAEEK